MTDVFLEQAATYTVAASLLPSLLDRLLPDLTGLHILIKPNFVAQRNAVLACTDARIIHAVSIACLDRGASRVVVGDSPAFGSARSIAGQIGLLKMLAPYPVNVITLGRGVQHMSGGIKVLISKDALDADLILNLPKCKAHSQMRYTGAVKNLFGCVVGVRKAVLHARHGDKSNDFQRMICGFMDILPPTINIMDGIVAMHHTGPINGQPFHLRLLGASTNPVALDTAMGMVFGKTPDDFPLWRECIRQGRKGAQPEDLRFPLATPQEYFGADFVFPHRLKPESFRPATLLRSLLRRFWLSLRA